MVTRSLVVLALIAATAGAEPPRAVKIQDTVGFDWLEPRASKCTKVAGRLLARLNKDYQCAPPDNRGATGSGVTIVATCKTRNGKSEFLLFATAADCAKERDMQLANAE